MLINIKKRHQEAKITLRTCVSCGYNIHALLEEDILIEPGEIKLIDTGIEMEVPEDWFIGIYSSKDLVLSKGLSIANGVEIVDRDYDKEIKLLLRNESKESQIITNGEIIGIAVLQKFENAYFVEL